MFQFRKCCFPEKVEVAGNRFSQPLLQPVQGLVVFFGFVISSNVFLQLTVSLLQLYIFVEEGGVQLFVFVF